MDNFSKYLVMDYLDKYNYLLTTGEGFGVVDREGREILKKETFEELAAEIFDIYHEKQGL